MKSGKLRQICSLIACLLIMMAVAITKNQKLLGHELNHVENTVLSAPLVTNADGTAVVYTRELAKDVMGYGGAIPLEIQMKDGRITAIKAERNAESPDFFAKVEEGLMPKWNGLTPDEALQLKVDAVSGATLSSNAVIENVQRGMEYAHDAGVTASSSASVDKSMFTSPKFLCALIVTLMAAILPLFVRIRLYREIQLSLNVIVLGIWSGTFISYTLMVNYLSNGFNLLTSLVPLIMLIVAFIYPLFGKKNHYCNWMCPLGSLQELAGRAHKHKWHISQSVLKYLNYFHDGLWAVLMLLMWSGVLFEWMDYELFTAFLFRQASVAVIVVALCFIVLSLFVSRPYCRFVCPTGTLFRISQNNK